VSLRGVDFPLVCWEGVRGRGWDLPLARTLDSALVEDSYIGVGWRGASMCMYIHPIIEQRTMQRHSTYTVNQRSSKSSFSIQTAIYCSLSSKLNAVYMQIQTGPL